MGGPPVRGNIIVFRAKTPNFYATPTLCRVSVCVFRNQTVCFRNKTVLFPETTVPLPVITPHCTCILVLERHQKISASGCTRSRTHLTRNSKTQCAELQRAGRAPRSETTLRPRKRTHGWNQHLSIRTPRGWRKPLNRKQRLWGPHS